MDTDEVIETLEIIDHIISEWRIKHSVSPMVITDEKVIQRLDIIRAKKHVKFVRLCDILFNWIPNYQRSIRHIKLPELNSISPKVNAVRLAEYESKIKKQNDIKDSMESLLKAAKEIIDFLQIRATIEQITNDYNNNRIFLKRNFSTMFSLYGIDLDDEMLENIFGREKATDNIFYYSRGKNLHSSLSGQFATTLNGEANGLFSAFFMRAAGMLKQNSNEHKSTANENYYFYYNSPLYAEVRSLKILAFAISKIILNRKKQEP